MIGGNGERRTLRLVARYADMCNVYGSPEDVRRRFGALRGHCEEAGRPYEEVTRTVNLWTLLARDGAEKAEKRERFPQALSVDTPGETVAEIKEYEAAGAQHAIVKILDAADLDPVRLFAEKVMSAFPERDRPAFSSRGNAGSWAPTNRKRQPPPPIAGQDTNLVAAGCRGGRAGSRTELGPPTSSHPRITSFCDLAQPSNAVGDARSS